MKTRMFWLTMAAALTAAGAARAAVFNVNSTADAVDAAPGNGVCLTALGVCTLRAAVQEANNFPGADTIALPAGNYVLTIAGGGENASASGDLDVIRDLTILGAGRDVTFIDGNNGAGFNDGVIDVLGTPMVNIGLTLRDVTVRNGRDVGLQGGGGINVGDGSLAMYDAAVRDCETQASGGGIDYTSANAPGTLVLENTEITGNDALTSVISALPGGGGGVAIGGGFATATLTNVRVTGNTVGGGQGGGVLVWVNATATLTDVTIDGNSAFGEAEPPFDRSMGGGLAVWTANAILDGVTVSLNTAHAGGGIGALDGSLVMENVTISGNTALPIAILPAYPAIGGGIGAIMAPGFSVTMRGSNWTIADNIAADGGAIGAVVGAPGDFQAFVANSILA
ncbi:MAG: CSLREA domain-containing protein, partial [Myxococcales bacterium]|nr:CSLREA domain-containing protein [Myxococcales bacterium]